VKYKLAACGVLLAGTVLSITIPLVPPASGAEFAALEGKLDVVTNDMTQPPPGAMVLVPQFARLLLFCTLKNIRSVLLFALKISVPGEHAVSAVGKIFNGLEMSSRFSSFVALMLPEASAANT
jgi:hypothetical protein